VSAAAPDLLKAWVIASRPKTLFASVSPIILGTALACSRGLGDGTAAFAALIGAIFIQIGTNLANDYWDAKKGADRAERLGPTRVTSGGLLTPRTVFLGMAFCFAFACLAGVYLIARAGWPVVVIGLVSIGCGILYTAGPFALAYIGLGDVFTFVFFGLVATSGTYFVEAREFSTTSLVLGSIPGFYSVVLIALNNLRDRESDLLSNKKTLAVRFGSRFARWEIAVCLFAPCIAPLWLWRENLLEWWMVLVCLVPASVAGFAVGRPVFRIQDMRQINRLFPLTGLASLSMALVVSGFLLLRK
jgi:1,4-dihydroxy-2-naphthoate octaprenyltransferase